MPLFKKSKEYDENHIVVHDGDAIPFHDKETGALYRNLTDACRRDSGYGTWEFFDGASEVVADRDGVTLRSRVRGGTWQETKMNYGDARRLLESIEDQVKTEEILKKI